MVKYFVVSAIVCIYVYLCEYCMMGRWPLCTIQIWIWIRLYLHDQILEMFWFMLEWFGLH